jgi:hypothetical protein
MLPSSLTYIGSNAFISCNIETLTIPSNVTYIGYESFTGINTCHIYAKNPPKTDSHNIPINGTTLYVPKGSLESYKDEWGGLFKNIYEMDE